MSLPIIHKYGTSDKMLAQAVTPGTLYVLTDVGEIWFDNDDNTRVQVGNIGTSEGGDITVDPVLSGTSTNPPQNRAVFAALKEIKDELAGLDYADTAVADQFVTAVNETNGLIAVTRAALPKASASKDGTMSKEDFVKLRDIETGAQKNVQSDWTEANAAKDAFIKNKPTLGDAALLDEADIIDTLTKEVIISKLGYTPEDASNKAASNGYAPLSGGKIPADYLPSYISEIVSYSEKSLFPATGSDSKLYYDSQTNSTYRWNGTAYTQVTAGLTLGETASTAYPGNKGKIAYDHAMKHGAKFGTGTNNAQVGFYKFVTNEEGHVTNAVPVTATDITDLGITGGDTTYTAGTGISITGGSIANAGVTAVAEGTANGTVAVTTNGSTSNVNVHGLGSAAYVNVNANVIGTDTTNTVSSKGIATYVDTQLDDYLKKEDEKTYSIKRSTDDKKIELTQDGTTIASIDDKGNIQADWNETTTTADAFIKNKPDVYTKTEVNTELAKKVDKVTGKDLSANDFTDVLKTKLDGVEEGAEKNVDAFGKVIVNGTTVAAAADGDTFTLAEGSNITLTANAATKTITIASTGGGGEGTGDYDDTALKERITALETKTADLPITIDAALSATSANPVQNKAVKAALDSKANTATTIAGYGITDAYTKTQVDTELAKKADKATTLSGYGITDAYTKTEVDTTLNDYLKKADEKTYTLTQSTDKKTIYLKDEDNATVSTVTLPADVTPTTYALSKSGKTVTLTGSDASTSSIDLDEYKLQLSYESQPTVGIDILVPGANFNTSYPLSDSKYGRIAIYKDSTLVNECNAVMGIKGSAESTYRTGYQTIKKDDIGLAKVENLSAAEIRDGLTKAEVVKALNYTPADEAKKGVASGYAELDVNGKVPTSQLPSYLSEVKEFASVTTFPTAGDSSIIYLALDTMIQYRWSGSAYSAISGTSLALGETSETAYRGDRGKTAYDHSQDSGKLATAQTSGFYKFSSTAEGHVGSVTAVVKKDLTDLGVLDADQGVANAKKVLTVGTDGIVTTSDATKHYYITLPAGSTTTTVSVPGITANDCPIISLDTSVHNTTTTAAAASRNFSKVYRAVTSAGAITFYSYENIVSAVSLIVKVVGPNG